MNTSVDTILGALRKKGLRMTKNRIALVSLFAHAERPLSASEIIKRLRLSKLRPDKTTIYRELHTLKRSGVIQEVRIKNDAVHFEIAAEHHHHLICIRCDAMTDVVLDRDVEQLLPAAPPGNFIITAHSLEFFGVCGPCNSTSTTT